MERIGDIERKTRGSRSSLARHWPELATLIFGLLASGGLSWLSWDREDQQRTAQVRESVEITAEALHETLLHLVEDVQILAQLFDASGSVDADAFSRFTRPFIRRHPELHALEWAPRVPGAEREAFEAAARAQGLEELEIREPAGGRLRRAAARAEYFPVLRLEPLAGNTAALGLDAGSEPRRREALMRACTSGRPAASAPVTLVQEPASQRGLILFAPEYDSGPADASPAERCARVRGFAIGVLRLGDLVETVFARLPYDHLDLLLRDADLADDDGVLLVQPSGSRTPGAISSAALASDPRGHEVAIAFAGRHWLLRGVPAGRSGFGPALPLALLVLGLAVTGGFTGLVRNRRAAARRLRASEARLRVLIEHAPAALEAERAHLEERVDERTAELQRSEAKLRTIFDLLPIGLSITDPDGQIVDCNRAAEDLLGLTLADHLERTFDGPEWHVVRPDGSPMPPEEYASVRAMREDRVVEDFEAGIVRPEGVTWLSVSAMPAQHPDYGVVVAFADVTERKRAEAALRASEARARAIIDASPVPQALADPSGVIRYLNPAFVRTFGYTLDELPTLDAWRHRAYPDSDYRRWVERTWQQYREQIVARETADPVEVAIRCRDGSVCQAVACVVALDLPDQGEAGLHLATVYDITPLKQAQETAEQAAQTKMRFLAHMSHEIRTPMNGLLGLSELALHEPLTPLARDYLDQIHQSAHALLAILNDILDQSKIESGLMRLETAPFQLAELLGDLRGLLRQTAAAKGLSLVVEAAPEVPRRLHGDVLRLRQVLANLLSNALKFTEHGEIRLGVELLERTRDTVTLRWSVTDSGIGMDPATREQLFSPFTQGDASIARRFGGTGLGLSISRELVALMGGQLLVTSTPGQGSAFSFDTRLDVPPDLARPGTAPAPVRAIPAGARILVAEDQPISQRVIGDMLRLLGGEPTLARSGEEALARLAELEHDAVLMDIQMPGMDGLTATRRLRANPAWAKLPVIALTAGVTEAERDEVAAAGLDDLLPKPVTIDALKAMLGRWLTASASLEGPSATPAEPIEPEAPLELPGFNLGTLRQIAEDEDDLRALLHQLADSIRGDADAIAAALDSGDPRTAAQVAHRLKGVAGTAGAVALHQAAEQLETALKTESADLTASLEHLRETQAQALTQVARLGEASAPRPARAEADPEARARQLSEIGALLEQRRFVPPALLNALRAALPASEQPAYQALRACLDQFDYPAAERCLTELRGLDSGSKAPPA